MPGKSKLNVKHFFKPYRVYSCFKGAAIGFYVPLLTPALQDKGLSLFLVGLLASSFELSKIVFEIPTGAWADTRGIKQTLTISGLASMVAWAIFVASHSFWAMVLALSLLALSESLASGTHEAWITRSEPADQFGKELYLNTAIAISSIFVTSTLSGLLYRTSPAYPFICAFLVGLVQVGFLIQVSFPRHPAVSRENKNQNTIRNTVRDAYQFLSTTPQGFTLLASGILMSMANEAVGRFWQPRLSQLGFPPTKIALVFSAAVLLSFVLLVFSSRISSFLESKPFKSLLLLDFVAFAVCICLLPDVGPLVLGSLVLFLSLEDLRVPLSLAYLGVNCPDNHKATLFSIYSAGCAAGEAASGIIFGWLMEKWGIRVGFAGVAIVILFAFLFMLTANMKSNSSPQ